MVTELSDRNVVFDRDLEELVAFREEQGIAPEVDENFDRRKGWVFEQFTMRLHLRLQFFWECQNAESRRQITAMVDAIGRYSENSGT